MMHLRTEEERDSVQNSVQNSVISSLYAGRARAQGQAPERARKSGPHSLRLRHEAAAAPQIPRCNTAERPPFFGQLAQLLRAGERRKAIAVLHAGAQAEVADGQHVGATEAEDE